MNPPKSSDDSAAGLRLCLVTPCLNAAPFLGEALNSVIRQHGFERVDYIVMDGGSTDDSRPIIARHAEYLKHWQSATDQGLYHAVEEGFRHSDAEIMGWLNADDMLCPWTIRLVLDIFAQLPEVDFITSKHPLVADARGVVHRADLLPGVNREYFSDGLKLPGEDRPATNFISQASTFWRRSLWEQAGGCFDHSLSLACDFELWSRLLGLVDLHVVESPMAIFRAHGTNLSLQRKDDYAREALAVLGRRRSGRPQDAERLARRVESAKAQAIGLPASCLRHPGSPMPLKCVAFDEQAGRYVVIDRGAVPDGRGWLSRLSGRA